MKKLKAAALSLAVIMLTACEPISQTLPTEPTAESSRTESMAETSISTTDAQAASETVPAIEEETVVYTEYVAEVPKIEKEDTSLKIEAEDCKPGGSLYTAKERKGFSGKGYVTGFFGGSADFVDFTAKLDTNQHYDITICAAADSEISGRLKVNERQLEDFTINGDGSFTKITIYGIYMNKGENKITISSGSDNFDLDYVEITDNKTIYNTEFEFEKPEENSKLSAEAADLLKELKECFGKKILTGQYVSSPDDRELEFIHQVTGKYPIIRFSDIGGYSGENMMMYNDEINSAAKWAEKGGIVGFMWFWNSPDADSPSVYSKKTDFSIKAAMTKMDITNLPIKEIETLYEKGLITLECLELINDIDAVSNALKGLAEEKIPVLWRPLHEAGGDWYWWGADGAEAYKWLYDLMYDRMTEYHKLNNLIWIWNGQSEEYMVDSDRFDIAAIDAYLPPETNYGSRSEQYQWLKSVTDSGKLLALSECSSIPDIDDMLRDNSLWSFFGLWFGEYLMDGNGRISGIYTTEEDLVKIYNAENSITLDNFSGT